MRSCLEEPWAHLTVTTTAVLVILVVQEVTGKGCHGLDIASNNLIQVFKFLWGDGKGPTCHTAS